ncbi:MAG: [FeFe] hydrogenase H-cluster radical SAM maturase HydG [Defluviitaleaceae bacterium]|nr:[FeFe] hydrogenase H-cluster radical SAM maturase HydG [Defluviitaleaceae bacterium]
MFSLNKAEISDALDWAEKFKSDRSKITNVLQKAARHKGLNYREASLLLAGAEDTELFALANEIKQRFYGSRIVLFAPIYLSNHCVNTCTYCPFHAANRDMPRRKLSQEEIKTQVRALLDMGHKRVVIEAGDHPSHSTMDYITESIETIYGVRHKNSAIRRINVNTGAASIEDYAKLKSANIGTYTLFQETYDRTRYEEVHPGNAPKSSYDRQLEAMDRAMQGGLDDVGMGVLFGLSDYRFEIAALLSHAEYLEGAYGAGPHTISVPRIRKAEGVRDEFNDGINERTLLRIVATIRIAAPYTGIIASTRENSDTRAKMLAAGVSQISGGSRTSVGGYSEREASENIQNRTKSEQFETHDNRTLGEVVNWLMENGHIPSFCTSCYREGRTGDRFMQLCKSGQIQNYCQPNALLTLQEYLLDYPNNQRTTQGEAIIAQELEKIANPTTKTRTTKNLKKINSGTRNLTI